MDWNEENIEAFVRKHKDQFDIYRPEPNHEQHFLIKLINKFKKIISIVPYLIKVGIVSIVIFISSFIVWRQYICPPLTHVSLKYWKVEHVYKYQIHRDTRILLRNYIKDTNKREDFKQIAEQHKYVYEILKKKLKNDHSAENIVEILSFYKDQINYLNVMLCDYKIN